MFRFSFQGNKKIVISVIIASLFSNFVLYADDFSTTTLLDIVTIARVRLQKSDFSGAVDPLEEAIKRLNGTADERKKVLLQKCRFQLARAYNKLGKIKESLTLLETYLNNSPRPDESLALRIMAQNLFDSKDWPKIEKVARRLLALPSQKLTRADRLDANLMLGQALFKQSKWKESIAPLEYAVNNSKDHDSRRVIQIMIIHALVESKNWPVLYTWIPRVYRTDAKYDITLNLTIMKAAKSRFDAGEKERLNALLLYRMVLPRERLLWFSNKKIRKLRDKLAHSDSRKKPLTRYERKQLIAQIEDVQKLIIQVQELPPYEDEVALRIGQIYRQKKRYWEGYVLFEHLYKSKPGTEISDAAIIELATTLYDLNEIERAEKLITGYLDKHIKGRSAPTLLSLLVRWNLEHKQIKKLLSYRKYLDALPDSEDKDKQVVLSNLHYMMGFGCLYADQYAESADQFETIIEKYPKSEQIASAYYFKGLALMMQMKYAAAVDAFKAYIEKFKSDEYYEPAQFRLAVCLFGLEKYEEAEKKYTEFIEKYPANNFISEAYSMRGDIRAAKDSSIKGNENALDEAIEDYKMGFKKAVTKRQADYAVFRAAEVYLLEERYQEIIDFMNYYLKERGDKADVSKAVYWIGKAEIANNQIDRAIAAYVKAIFDFGNNRQLDGVDKISRELVGIADHRLDAEGRKKLLLRIELKSKSIEPDEKTLKIRIKTLLAALQGKESLEKLGLELLKTEKDLDLVPPTGLGLMCDAAVETKDLKEIERLYDYFTKNHPDSSELWKAYRAKAYQLTIQKQYNKVLLMIDTALNNYGPESYMDWAQIMKARTLFSMKKYEEARKSYELVLTVSAWRGPIFAEAMYGIGKCYEIQKQYKKAHIFYQRTYLLYKALGPKWAAKAYLDEAKVLLELDETKEAIKAWKRMLKDPYMKGLKEREEAEKLLKKYEGS